VKLTAARAAGSAARTRKANERAPELLPTINEIRQSGVTTHQGIADALNARSIPTACGSGTWSAVEERRTLARLAH
jgi:hypothetical protein